MRFRELQCLSERMRILRGAGLVRCLGKRRWAEDSEAEKESEGIARLMLGTILPRAEVVAESPSAVSRIRGDGVCPQVSKRYLA